MESWDIHCCKCGAYIMTEQRESVAGDISTPNGTYEEKVGYYDGIGDEFYCKSCAAKLTPAFKRRREGNSVA